MTGQGSNNAIEKLPYVKWGWHFRPTDAELINNLRKKVKLQTQESAFEPEDVSDVLREIDLSQVEPWQIKDIKETCNIRNMFADEHNQFFYAQKEQKYRHGGRANRATRHGFWKATGRDKPIFGPSCRRDIKKPIIGYRKALVFYEGRAPHGTKTDWILHEYRLENGADSSAREEQWVACHMFIKERNVQHNQTPGTVEVPADLLRQQQQLQQDADWMETEYNQKGKNVKVEPGYPSYSHVGSSHMSNGFIEQDNMRYAPICAEDEFNLPHLEVEEENPYTVHCPRPIEVRGSLAGPLLDLSAGNLPSFNDRVINEILYGMCSEQQMEVEQHPPYDTTSFDILWT